MLTISEVAQYAGVSVRAVRHYHQLGLLPEPVRDELGHRRYDAAALVMLRRISTLADAGVPLRRALDEAVASEDHRSDPTGQ
ncbi:MerR-like DNA binding protein [Luteococcus japonicus]|uniref:Regulatory protein, MerR n=2 Tax=Luteococcus japonicus TaxID=33984 RepID=A0A1R4I9C5_9ACTN|nr:MerR-like DNA binding protein [Luteococcus japonicus]SJN16214.1 regulatory protein, MerR [Luteococcus japonicus LSP_Lj1]